MGRSNNLNIRLKLARESSSNQNAATYPCEPIVGSDVDTSSSYMKFGCLETPIASLRKHFFVPYALPSKVGKILGLRMPTPTNPATPWNDTSNMAISQSKDIQPELVDLSGLLLPSYTGAQTNTQYALVRGTDGWSFEQISTSGSDNCNCQDPYAYRVFFSGNGCTYNQHIPLGLSSRGWSPQYINYFTATADSIEFKDKLPFQHLIYIPERLRQLCKVEIDFYAFCNTYEHDNICLEIIVRQGDSTIYDALLTTPSVRFGEQYLPVRFTTTFVSTLSKEITVYICTRTIANDSNHVCPLNILADAEDDDGNIIPNTYAFSVVVTKVQTN